MNAAANPVAELSQIARPRLNRPFLIGDWTRALFLHFEVPVEALRPHVPSDLDLDLWEGRAFVSAVAFSMEHLRPGFGGALGRWLFRPIACHDFFNVRAYVRRDGVPGIFFLREWLNHRLCVLSGPGTYGLPYRFARIQYKYRSGAGRWLGKVGDGLAATAKIPRPTEWQTCAPGGLDEFLIERYTAYTCRHHRARYFHIRHQPWPQVPAEARLIDDRLLRNVFPWYAQARLVTANYSPGVHDVWMGAPTRRSV